MPKSIIGKFWSIIDSPSYINLHHFRYEGKPSCTTAKSTLVAVSKDEWGTKEDTGKSMKNALCILRYAKRHLLGEVTFNSEKIKPISLAIIELRLSEASVSQSLTQSVTYSVSRKLLLNFVKIL